MQATKRLEAYAGFTYAVNTSDHPLVDWIKVMQQNDHIRLGPISSADVNHKVDAANIGESVVVDSYAVYVRNGRLLTIGTMVLADSNDAVMADAWVTPEDMAEATTSDVIFSDQDARWSVRHYPKSQAVDREKERLQKLRSTNHVYYRLERSHGDNYVTNFRVIKDGTWTDIGGSSMVSSIRRKDVSRRVTAALRLMAKSNPVVRAIVDDGYDIVDSDSDYGRQILRDIPPLSEV